MTGSTPEDCRREVVAPRQVVRSPVRLLMTQDPIQDSGLDPGEFLKLVEVPVETVLGEELLVAALLDELALV